MPKRSDSRPGQAGPADLARQPESLDISGAKPRVWHDPQQVRAILFEDILEEAACTALIPVVAAIAVLVSFWSSPHRIYCVILLALATVAAGAALSAAHFHRRRKTSPRGVGIGLLVVTGVAAVMGLVWGSMPMVLFASADADHRLAVAMTSAVVLGCVLRFGAVPIAAALYVAPISIGSVVGFALSDSPIAFAFAILVPLYGWFLVVHCRATSRVATRRAVDRISVVEQNHAIEEILLDFDDTGRDWLWRTDPVGQFVNVGPDVAADLSIESAEGCGFETIFNKLALSSATNGARVILASFKARKPFRNLLVEVRHGDESRWLRISGKPAFDSEGRFAGYRGIGSDMTGTRTFESRIAHLANFDPLTGFANRTNFQTYAARQCADAVTDGHCRALLSLDLDGFKTVNDSLGHEGGDELLRQVAIRLTTAAPAGAYISRLGSDEFAVWLHPTTPSKAETAARALTDALSVPFDVNAHQMHISASVGIAYAPKHALDPNELLTKADLALYHAKAASKGQVRVFAPEFETPLIDRRKLEGDLKLALARGEFALHYQPIIDVAAGRIVSFESLIRWQSPDRGFVSPADFIPAAESMGLIAAIGRWVLFEACRAAASWPYDVRVAVNVSPPQVRSPDFLHDVTMALKTSGLHPSRLEIEVTEGLLLDKSFAALDTLNTLRKRGVSIALDDFGTGYSSMTYLVDFPVDKIKIDRSFISNFIESHANRAIVEAMLGLARKLSIRVTAEGVESKDEALALKRLRCDELQGYLFSRPRPGSDVAALIASVPLAFREAIPTYMDSPLAMALTAKKAAV